MVQESYGYLEMATWHLFQKSQEQIPSLPIGLQIYFPPSFQRAPGELPWWIWLGGGIGVVLVTTSLIFVPRIGSLPWFAAVMTGQIVAALLLDHYGLLGNPKAVASPLRLLGAGLMVASVMVVVYAKHSEVRLAESDQAKLNNPSDLDPSD